MEVTGAEHQGRVFAHDPAVATRSDLAAFFVSGLRGIDGYVFGEGVLAVLGVGEAFFGIEYRVDVVTCDIEPFAVERRDRLTGGGKGRSPVDLPFDVDLAIRDVLQVVDHVVQPPVGASVDRETVALWLLDVGLLFASGKADLPALLIPAAVAKPDHVVQVQVVHPRRDRRAVTFDLDHVRLEPGDVSEHGRAIAERVGGTGAAELLCARAGAV